MLVLLHGYAAHFNRPKYIAFVQMLLSAGIAVATIDLEGHGYSEGVRGYVEDYVLMVDDVQQFVELIASGTAHISQLPCPEDKHAPRSNGAYRGTSLPLPESEGAEMAKLPFFIGGQSMGGGLSLLAGHRVTSKCEMFRGCVLLCPALAGHTPPAPVTFFLRYVVAALFPLSRMPSFLDSTSDASAIWKGDGIVKWHAVHDTWGRPGGLGFGLSMRWGTAASLLGMLDTIRAAAPDINFPLLLVHDPEDKVIPFVGSLTLLENVPSTDKTLIKMEGSLHDQMCNKPGEIAMVIKDWARPRTAVSDEKVFSFLTSGT